MKTNIPQRSEYVGTFTKSTGEARTMRFTTSEANLKKCGLITVYDVEKCGLRKFNLSTLIGRIAMVSNDLPSKKRGGAFLLIGFMVLGGFVVQRGFIAEGRV